MGDGKFALQINARQIGSHSEELDAVHVEELDGRGWLTQGHRGLPCVPSDATGNVIHAFFLLNGRRPYDLRQMLLATIFLAIITSFRCDFFLNPSRSRTPSACCRTRHRPQGLVSRKNSITRNLFWSASADNNPPIPLFPNYPPRHSSALSVTPVGGPKGKG